MVFIAHLDMDAFYASVELLRHPALRGRPLVIGGRRRVVAVPDVPGLHMLRDYAGRGVVTTSTYEARALGVFSGMGLMKSAKLAPEAVLLPADFDEYQHYSRLFKAAVCAVAPEIEDRGIDEIFIDLTALVTAGGPGQPLDPWLRAREIAAQIQQAVFVATGLSCSIGVTPNKLLAKIASDLDKPAGLTILREADVTTRLWPLPVRKINGIGPKAGGKLETLGIHSIGELAAVSPLLLVQHFGGSFGHWLHEAAHGRDERRVVTHREAKSISRETTFETDLHALRDRARLSVIFTALCERVAADLQRKGLVGRTIGLKLRYDNFSTLTRDCSLSEPTADAQVIRRAAGSCLKRVPLDRRIRLLGVRVGALTPPGVFVAGPARNTGLFDEAVR